MYIEPGGGVDTHYLFPLIDGDGPVGPMGGQSSLEHRPSKDQARSSIALSSVNLSQ
jgi:hypothetical protein